MDNILFLILAGIVAYITIKDVSLFRRFNQNKKYIKCYEDVLSNKENVYEEINKFIEKTQTDEFKNKGRLIKVFYEINNEIDAKDTLEETDLKPIFYKKDKISKNLVDINSDSFIFVIMCMCKAYEKNVKSNIVTLMDKVKELPDLFNYVEYQTTMALANALLSREDKGVEFMTRLLNGSYIEFKYDKRLILLYKRVGAATLLFNEQDIDEFYKEDLKKFAIPAIGENILRSLNLYDQFKPVEEENNETKEIENNEENKE